MSLSASDHNRPAYEVADIFHQYGDAYRASHKMTKKQHEVMWAIKHCRTDRLGYHIDQCNHCGYIEQAFNSCRDRHCPKCQGIARHKWVTARLQQILPVPYYHVVFTLPHDLISLTAYNRRLIFNLLFDCAAKTLLSFGEDPRWLGGEVGFYGILHTWGQTLWPHPHVHIIMPGGALTKDGHWVTPPHRSRFLFPVRALSKVFRGKFVAGLKQAHCRQDLTLPDGHPAATHGLEPWIDHLVSRNWVVYCKAPVKHAARVLRYISRYTHRVAISNHRIINVDREQVQFCYKDYKTDPAVRQTMTLNAASFISRFLWHVLPAGFHKIRHYGFMANGRCKERIAYIKNLLSAGDSGKTTIMADNSVPLCPRCKTGALVPLFIYSMMKRRGPIIRNGYLLDTS